jgi:Tfp pilus assembly protein PilN
LLGAGGTGVGWARAALANQEATREQQTRLTALRTEVAQLRANAAEIAALRHAVESGAAGPPCGALLEKIARTVPASVTLTAVRIAGRTLTLEGWVAPGAGPTAVEAWRARLAPAEAPWTVVAQTAASGSFTLTGGFRL